MAAQKSKEELIEIIKINELTYSWAATIFVPVSISFDAHRTLLCAVTLKIGRKEERS